MNVVKMNVEEAKRFVTSEAGYRNDTIVEWRQRNISLFGNQFIGEIWIALTPDLNNPESMVMLAIISPEKSKSWADKGTFTYSGKYDVQYNEKFFGSENGQYPSRYAGEPLF